MGDRKNLVTTSFLPKAKKNNKINLEALNLTFR